MHSKHNLMKWRVAPSLRDSNTKLVNYTISTTLDTVSTNPVTQSKTKLITQTHTVQIQSQQVSSGQAYQSSHRVRTAWAYLCNWIHSCWLDWYLLCLTELALAVFDWIGSCFVWLDWYLLCDWNGTCCVTGLVLAACSWIGTCCVQMDTCYDWIGTCSVWLDWCCM